MDSPLSLTVAVVAECTFQDAVQCHQAHLFKQFKGLVGVCKTFPFVLTTERTDVTSLQEMEKNYNALINSINISSGKSGLVVL